MPSALFVKNFLSFNAISPLAKPSIIRLSTLWDTRKNLVKNKKVVFFLDFNAQQFISAKVEKQKRERNQKDGKVLGIR